MLSVKTKYANGRDYFTIEYCMFAEEKLHPFTTFSIHDATQKSTFDQTLNLFCKKFELFWNTPTPILLISGFKLRRERERDQNIFLEWFSFLKV